MVGVRETARGRISAVRIRVGVVKGHFRVKDFTGDWIKCIN